MTSEKSSNQRFPRRSAQQWQTIIQQFENSTLTINEFCEQESLGKVSFHKWYNRFKQQAAPSAVKATTDFIELTQTPPTEKTLSAIDTRHHRPWDIELELGGGIICRFRRE